MHPAAAAAGCRCCAEQAVVQLHERQQLVAARRQQAADIGAFRQRTPIQGICVHCSTQPVCRACLFVRCKCDQDKPMPSSQIMPFNHCMTGRCSEFSSLQNQLWLQACQLLGLHEHLQAVMEASR